MSNSLPAYVNYCTLVPLICRRVRVTHTISCIFHFIQICVCLCNLNLVSLVYLYCNPPESPRLPPHSILPETVRQLDHLFVFYLNTCKKICLNFPLCFWSGLPPIFLCGPTETLLWPQAASLCFYRLLGASIPPCIVPMPRVLASSHPFSAECLLWPCLLFSFGPFEACVPNTQGSSRDAQKPSLSPSFHPQS